MPWARTVASVIVTTSPTAPLRRRALLGAGALGLLGACSSPGQKPGARPVPETDPDTAVRLRELRATEALAALYGSAPAPALRPLRAQLAAQLAAFGQAPVARTPVAESGAGPTPIPAASRAALAAAERATALGRRAALPAASPALARLIASVAASGAQRAVLLGGSAPATAPMPVTAALPASALAALQAALAAENAAIYGYGVIGALLEGQSRHRATASYSAHRARATALQQQLGSRATPAAAAYELPFPVTGPASAVRLAALLENRLAAVYANGVQASGKALRTALASALQQSALDALTWSGSGSAFPGLPERGAPH